MVDCACNHFPTGNNVTIADRLGVGTTTPAQKLHAHGPVASLPETSGVNQTGIMRLSQAIGPGVLDFGFGGDGYGWLQATSSANLAASQGLLLNPNGGNVGVGTLAPARQFQVGAATGTSVGIVRLAGSTPGVGSRTWDVGPDPNGSPAHSFAITDVTAGTQRLVIKGDGSGNVGIGTTTPGKKLHVQSSAADSQLYLSDTSPSVLLGNTAVPTSATMNALLAVATVPGHYGLPAAGDVRLSSYGSARGNLYIDANYSGGGGARNVVIQPSVGNVGIGTTAPEAKLHVSNGEILASGSGGTAGRVSAREFYGLNSSGGGKKVADFDGCYYA